MLLASLLCRVFMGYGWHRYASDTLWGWYRYASVTLLLLVADRLLFGVSLATVGRISIVAYQSPPFGLSVATVGLISSVSVATVGRIIPTPN